MDRRDTALKYFEQQSAETALRQQTGIELYRKGSAQLLFETADGSPLPENITVEALVKKICDLKQRYTLYGGGRPFGTALLMAGCDDLGCHLFETDPSGALVAYKADSIGSGRPAVLDVFEKEFVDDMSYEDAMILGLKALKAAIEETPAANTVEVAVVKLDEPFRRLPAEEVAKFIEKL